MARHFLSAAVALVAFGASPALAAERTVNVASFERVRVQGPFAVAVAHGGPPGAVIAGDRAAIENVEVAVEGTTLTVRRRLGRLEEPPHGPVGQPITITIDAVADLAGGSVVGGGRLTLDRIRSARADLAVTGAGGIDVAQADADQLVATVIGGGTVAVAGRAGTARLLTNGAGTIDAGRLDAGDLFVRVDGPGATQARARYTARVINTGLGQIRVAGRPKCTVAANAGTVTCGTDAP